MRLGPSALEREALLEQTLWRFCAPSSPDPSLCWPDLQPSHPPNSPGHCLDLDPAHESLTAASEVAFRTCWITDMNPSMAPRAEMEALPEGRLFCPLPLLSCPTGGWTRPVCCSQCARVIRPVPCPVTPQPPAQPDPSHPPPSPSARRTGGLGVSAPPSPAPQALHVPLPSALTRPAPRPSPGSLLGPQDRAGSSLCHSPHRREAHRADGLVLPESLSRGAPLGRALWHWGLWAHRCLANAS